MLDPLTMPGAGVDDHWALFLAYYFDPKLNSAKQSDQFIILCKYKLIYSLFKIDNITNSTIQLFSQNYVFPLTC